MKLAYYTVKEGTALEDHYVAMYKKMKKPKPRLPKPPAAGKTTSGALTQLARDYAMTVKGPYTVVDIADALDIDVRGINKVLGDLQIEGKVVRLPQKRGKAYLWRTK